MGKLTKLPNILGKFWEICKRKIEYRIRPFHRKHRDLGLKTTVCVADGEIERSRTKYKLVIKGERSGSP